MVAAGGRERVWESTDEEVPDCGDSGRPLATTSVGAEAPSGPLELKHPTWLKEPQRKRLKKDKTARGQLGCSATGQRTVSEPNLVMTLSEGRAKERRHPRPVGASA